jgi:hypothetical protein
LFVLIQPSTHINRLPVWVRVQLAGRQIFRPWLRREIFGDVRFGTKKAYEQFPAVVVQEVFQLSIFSQSYQHYTGGSFLARRLRGLTQGTSDQFMNQHLLVKIPERRRSGVPAFSLRS